MAPFSQDFSECSADGGARRPPGTRYTEIVPYIYRQTVNKTGGACGFCVKTDGKLPQNFQKSGNGTRFFRPHGSHPISCARRHIAPGGRRKTERAQQTEKSQTAKQKSGTKTLRKYEKGGGAERTPATESAENLFRKIAGEEPAAEKDKRRLLCRLFFPRIFAGIGQAIGPRERFVLIDPEGMVKHHLRPKAGGGSDR